MNMLTRLKRRMGEIGCYTYVTVLAVFAAFPLYGDSPLFQTLE